MVLNRFVGIMVQISIIILFRISLKISSLCLILFFVCLWFCHDSPFTNKLLNILAIYKTFLHYITSLSVSWSFTSSKSLTFTASSTVPEVEVSLLCYFYHLFFLLTFLQLFLIIPKLLQNNSRIASAIKIPKIIPT